MRLLSLTLTHYRNIESAQIELHPRLTIFLGPNGIGKTNILEAVSLLSLPRSFRGSKDDQLRQWEADFARVEGHVALDQGIERSLVVFLNGGKKLQIDGQPQTASEFIGTFLSTLFAPEEVDLLAGPPSRRRGFLDAHLSQLSRSYFQHLLHYNKVLVRRNRLLARHASGSELDYWNSQQIEHGVALIEARQAGLARLQQLLSPTLQLRYVSSLVEENADITAFFQEKQSRIVERELVVGHTLLGPQRDDWRLDELSLAPALPTRDLGHYGSRGEQRMAVIQLKQSQLQDILAQTQHTAVLLLDDVLSELDAENQQRLVTSLGEQQTLLTTASLTDVPEALLQDAYVYEKIGGEWIRPVTL